MHSVLLAVRDFSHALLDFAYPPFCLLCEEQLGLREKHVCERCWQQLPLCENSDTLPPKLRNRGFLHLFSLWQFEGGVQKIIHEFKYSRMLSLGRRMGKSLAKALENYPDYVTADMVIPVPLHRARFRERGYNQSLVIAKAFSEATGIVTQARVLRRKRNTKSQAKLNAEEREVNMAGAFEVKNGGTLVHKTVIVLDDVCTTGATLQGCAKALLSAGVSCVLGLTVAHTPQPE